VQKIEIHALGFVLHTLQLHRHRAAEVAEHSHPFEQLILFVSGEGWQKIGQQWHPATAGDLFIIPRGVSHGFGVARPPPLSTNPGVNAGVGGARPPGALGPTAFGPRTRTQPSATIIESAHRRGRAPPLSLVLDYEVKAAAKKARVQHRHLSPALLDDLRRELARIPAKGRLGLAHYPAVLEVIARLLEPRTTAAAATAPAETWARVAQEGVRRQDSLAAVARETGYHRDHLTRKLKRAGGLGLRGLRDRYRLETAEAALRGAATVGEAATAAGFDDANYFARWFRRRTGQTPSAFKS